MKKFCIIFLLSIIISLTAFGFSGVLVQNPSNGWGRYGNTATSKAENEYLRIHIRADSNDNDAQAVKYAVRDKVVAYLTPLVAEYQTQEQAVVGIEENLEEIACVATETLQEKGFSYGARAEIKREKFPTRVYGEYTLPSGEYTALILYLGRGQGDNWWCVVYPPLCFASGEGNPVYKSKIAEIILSFRARNKG